MASIINIMFNFGDAKRLPFSSLARESNSRVCLKLPFVVSSRLEELCGSTDELLVLSLLGREGLNRLFLTKGT